MEVWRLSDLHNCWLPPRLALQEVPVVSTRLFSITSEVTQGHSHHRLLVKSKSQGQPRFKGKGLHKNGIPEGVAQGAALGIVGMGVEGEVSLNLRASGIAVTLKAHAILNTQEGGVGR